MAAWAIITGSSGGIGNALVKRYIDAGFKVIGIDLYESNSQASFSFIEADLNRFCIQDSYRTLLINSVIEKIGQEALHVLINNAALQIISPTSEISTSDWLNVMNVNVNAPLLLIRDLLPKLRSSKGSIVNISSIHAEITKPGFAMYATSKAALSGMTRALAVDIGGEVRVNAIAPAAIETPMLSAGFCDKPDALSALKAYHPVGFIGKPHEVADAAFFLSSEESKFLNGAIIKLDGGISARLYDPA